MPLIISSLKMCVTKSALGTNTLGHNTTNIILD